MTVAYVYKWTHIPTMRWYIGSRTAKGCHPKDGYVCSSKTIKPMILENANDWKREIIATGIKEDMLSLETEILQLFDAKNDSRSFNQQNGDGKFINKGLRPLSDQHKLNLSLSKKGRTAWNKGRKETRPDVLHKMSSSHIGKPRVPHTDETKQKIAESEKRTKQAKKLVATEVNVQVIKGDVQ
jgi:hypothetical protein